MAQDDFREAASDHQAADLEVSWKALGRSWEGSGGFFSTQIPNQRYKVAFRVRPGGKRGRRWKTSYSKSAESENGPARLCHHVCNPGRRITESVRSSRRVSSNTEKQVGEGAGRGLAVRL